MTLLDRKLLRDISAMRGQVITIALVVAAGVAVFVASISTYDSLRAGRDRFYAGARFPQVFVTLKRAPLSIVAQLNMDMVGRGEAIDLAGGGPNYLQLVGSRRLSTELGDLVEKVNAERATPFKFDYQYDQNGDPNRIYCRSDHYSYARYGIPIVFFTTGLHADYHQVTDEPQYIAYDHMKRVGEFVRDIAVRVADLDHRPVVDKPVSGPTATCVQ